MKIILALLLIAGLGTSVFVPAADSARTAAIWSDFLSFQSRVMADPAGERILNYGGENEKENFNILVERLKNMDDTSPAQEIGLGIAFLAAIGLVLEFKRNRKYEPAGIVNDGAAPHRD